MPSCFRDPKCFARLACEPLEDRVTPVVAYLLSGTSLLAFDTVNPTVTAATAITNIAPGETLAGIDFRPQNGLLYGLGVNATTDTATLYAISTRTGFAGVVGTAGGVTGAGDLPPQTTFSYGFDFDPVTDRVRVTTSTGLNFRVNPNTGTLVGAGDTPLNGAATRAEAAAYTNNQANGATTTLYVLDEFTDSLYIQNPADGGSLTLVAPLTLGGNLVNYFFFSGFDIPAGVDAPATGAPVPAGSALAAFNSFAAVELYSVDLVTARMTFVGTIANASVSGLAIQNDYAGFPAIGLSGATPGAADLVRFNTATPGITTTQAITPIAGGDTLVGVAFRPATGQLYGLGVTAAGAGTLYRIDPQTGATTTVGAVTGGGLGALPNPATATSGFGFAFDATMDLIRVVTSAGQSFSVNPNTGAVGTVAATVGGATTTVDAAASTNGFGQPTGANAATTLYVLDSTTDRLLIQNPSTSMTKAVAPVTFNGGSLDFSAVNGFDIPAGVTVSATGAVASGFGYATLTVGVTTSLYRINLATGVATIVDALGATFSGLTLADVPGGVVSFQSATLTGNEGGAVNVVLTRTSGNGPQTATVSRTGGSASGADFAGGPYTVTFVEGATTATLTIPLTADMLTEGTETLGLTLSAPGAALGAQFNTTVSINDTSVTPPAPPPFFSGAVTVPGGAVLVGAGVPGGAAFLSLPLGSFAFFADVNGDGKGDVILFLPTLVAVLDGQTGRFLLLSADLNGDRIRDLQMFNLDGTTTTTDGKTGRVMTI